MNPQLVLLAESAEPGSGFSLLPLAAVGAASLFSVVASRRLVERRAEQEKGRILRSLGLKGAVVHGDVNVRYESDVAHEESEHVSAPTEASEQSGLQSKENSSDGRMSHPIDQGRFSALLIDYYSYGLSQAKLHSQVSLIMTVLGGIILLGGIFLAIFGSVRSEVDYAAVSTSVSGILTAASASLWHRQANRALEHMEGQTRFLREDMRRDAEVQRALDLLEQVDDSRVKNRLQASLILKFTGAASYGPGDVVDGGLGEDSTKSEASTGGNNGQVLKKNVRGEQGT